MTILTKDLYQNVPSEVKKICDFSTMYGATYAAIIVICVLIPFGADIFNDPINIIITLMMFSYSGLNFLAVYLILKKKKLGKVIMHFVAILPIVLFPVGTIHSLKMFQNLYSEEVSKYFNITEIAIDLIDSVS